MTKLGLLVGSKGMDVLQVHASSGSTLWPIDLPRPWLLSLYCDFLDSRLLLLYGVGTQRRTKTKWDTQSHRSSRQGQRKRILGWEISYSGRANKRALRLKNEKSVVQRSARMLTITFVRSDDPRTRCIPCCCRGFCHKVKLRTFRWRRVQVLIISRLKHKLQSEFSEIEEELGVKLSPLSWLSGFYSIPPEVQIAGTKAYQEGEIYGMDAASGAAVEALDICPGDHVLDLCAAPGAKLCMMADLLNDSGTITATDISPSRLAVSRTMLLKYGLGSRCRLFLADGTTFSLLPLKDGAQNSFITEVAAKADVKGLPKQTERHERHTVSTYVDSNVYGEWKSRKTAKEKKAAKRLKYLEDALDRVGGRESELLYYGKSSGVVGMKVADVFGTSCSADALDNGYDKVLVDAECTHDGSLKHIYKYEQWGWDTFERRFFNPERMSSLTSLQLSLLGNGFRLLKVGGTLVYSTCSFTVAQNEDVVKNFLAIHRNAELQKINSAKLWPCKAGGLPHTLRFDPVVSNSSGLFIAKISRLDT